MWWVNSPGIVFFLLVPQEFPIGVLNIGFMCPANIIENRTQICLRLW